MKIKYPEEREEIAMTARRLLGILLVGFVIFWVVREMINEQVERRVQQQRPVVAEKAKAHRPHGHKVRRKERKQETPAPAPAPAPADPATVNPQDLPVIEGTPAEPPVVYQQPQVVRQDVVVLRGGPFGNDFVDPYPYIPRSYNFGHRMGFVDHHRGDHHRGDHDGGYRRHR